MNNNNPFPKVSSISQKTVSRIIILVGILLLGLVIFGIVFGASGIKSKFKDHKEDFGTDYSLSKGPRIERGLFGIIVLIGIAIYLKMTS